MPPTVFTGLLAFWYGNKSPNFDNIEFSPAAVAVSFCLAAMFAGLTLLTITIRALTFIT
jgi:hypothetical protein